MLKSLLKAFKGSSEGVKASLAYFTASIITKGISYITTPIFTSILSAEEYGKTSVFLTWCSILGIIAMFQLQAGVFNNGMVDYPNERDQYSYSMLILSNIITLVFGICLVCIYPYVKRYLELDYAVLILMFIIFLFQPAYSFWSARQRYELKYKKQVAIVLLNAFVSPFFAIIAIKKFPSNGYYARVFGAEIPLIIIYMIFYIILIVNKRGKLHTEFWKPALLFNLPLIPHYLSTYLLNSSDKIMISRLVGDDKTAYYSVAYSVAAVVLIIWSATNSSLIPYTYEKCKIKDYKSISKTTIPILCLFAVACFGSILLAPEVLSVLATKEYSEAAYVIPPVVGGVFFQVQYYMYANIVYYYKKPKYIMYASVSATVLNLLLNYIFIKKFGYIAAGYTTLVCYMLQAVMDYFAMKSIVKSEIYDMKIVVVLSAIVLCFSLLGSMLYSHLVMRYIIIVSCLIAMICFRKTIIGYFKALRRK